MRFATIWQSIAQIRERYGDSADSILANSTAKIFMGPITDDATRQHIASLLGDELVAQVSQTATSDGHSGSTTVARRHATRPLPPPCNSSNPTARCSLKAPTRPLRSTSNLSGRRGPTAIVADGKCAPRRFANCGLPESGLASLQCRTPAHGFQPSAGSDVPVTDSIRPVHLPAADFLADIEKMPCIEL